MTNNEYPNRLHEIMENFNIADVQIASATVDPKTTRERVSKDTVTAVRTGKVRPRIDTAMLILQALNSLISPHKFSLEDLWPTEKEKAK